MSTQHTWTFSLIGGVKRVNLESGNDLLHLRSLDQKLWTALSCPVEGLEFDEKTLQLIDTDQNGQIRVPEILAAEEWITRLLRNPDDLIKREAELPLSALDDKNPEADYLLHCARIILQNLGKPDATTISVEDTSDITRIFASTPFNGDGVITELSTNDPELKSTLSRLIECMGGTPDRSGQAGISEAQLTSFFDACRAYDQWQKISDEKEMGWMVLGEHTAEAYSLLKEIQPKVNDFFLRCRLATFDPKAADILNQQQEQLSRFAEKNLESCLDEIAAFPLARIQSGSALPLQSGLNPAWENRVMRFAFLCNPLLKDKNFLSENDFEQLCRQFESFAEWISVKPETPVEKLGIAAVRGLLHSGAESRLMELMEKDKELEDEAASIIRVDQLVRYYRDLYALLNNFVSFYDFYNPGSKAIFQAGTLYIDQRSCDLCIRVRDLDRHENLSARSGMFLIYCRCKLRSGNEEMVIVAALTNGETDNLVVGRNAVFYDRSGRDWDATVIRITDNPISIRQAFWSPYRKVSGFIEKQVHKFASQQENKVQSQALSTYEKKTSDISTNAEQVMDGKPAQEKAAPPPPFDVGKFVGIFAAIGLALGALGTALTAMLAAFFSLTWWKMPIVIAAVMLLISGPAMIMAYLKLRKRNLAPILDANGWAINAQATVNISFGNLLTQTAVLPPHSHVNYNDPFQGKRYPMWLVILGLVIGIVLVLCLIHYTGMMPMW